MTSRRALCVSPRYAPSFGAFHYAYELTDGVKAFMPPQGLLVIAAALPKHWQVRFVDENMAPARPRPISPGPMWCSSAACTSSGGRSRTSAAAPIVAGKAAVLGGPSVSACPEYYPDFDYLHVGEIGDATDELFARLDAGLRAARTAGGADHPRAAPLTDFPLPAYELAEIDRYFSAASSSRAAVPTSANSATSRPLRPRSRA